jgi:hypothetical protein
MPEKLEIQATEISYRIGYRGDTYTVSFSTEDDTVDLDDVQFPITVLRGVIQAYEMYKGKMPQFGTEEQE